jgi:hypothetical protein
MKFKMAKPIKEFKPKKSHKLLYVEIILSLLVLACAGYGVYTFLTTFAFRTPVIFQSPIYRIKQNVLISPVASGSAKVSAVFDVGAIADKIYTLESSNGKNDSCKNLGLFNGYGFRQNSFEWVCYNSHEEVRELVINWLTKHIKDGDIASSLCLYNQGKVTDQCTYAMNFKSL